MTNDFGGDSVAYGQDKGDFDEVQVHALPAQDLVFQIYEDLGFRFHESEVKIMNERWPATMEDRRASPYWQELDFFFPGAYGWAGQTELETVLISRADALDVHPGGFAPVTLEYAAQYGAAWTDAIDQHIRKYWWRG